MSLIGGRVEWCTLVGLGSNRVSEKQKNLGLGTTNMDFLLPRDNPNPYGNLTNSICFIAAVVLADKILVDLRLDRISGA